MMTESPGSAPARHLRGIALANVAVVFFGLAGVLGKLSGLPAPVIVLGRVLFAGVVLLALAGVQRRPLRPRGRRDAVVLVAQGILLAVHWTAFFQSIAVSNVAVGLLSFSSFPLFTAALEPVLFRQRPSRIQIVAALLILPGIYLLVPAFTLQDRTTRGVAWGLLAGATFALLSVANRWLGRRYPSLTISLYQDGVALVALLPVLVLVPGALAWTPGQLLILLVLGVGCTALAHTLFIESMRAITAQSASLLASLEPVWGIAFGVLLLGEIPTGPTLLGGAIIVGATMLPGVVAWGAARRAPVKSGKLRTRGTRT
jgi:drug/metabolite transporter (DMT)-like permease